MTASLARRNKKFVSERVAFLYSMVKHERMKIISNLGFAVRLSIGPKEMVGMYNTSPYALTSFLNPTINIRRK